MSAVSENLHAVFLQALKQITVRTSSTREKPLCLDLLPPNPPRLRAYLYTLVASAGTVRANEYKVVLRVPGQAVGSYDEFDNSGGRLAMVIGYRADLDVFVLWDASLHPRFKNGGNIQVRNDTVYSAAATGRAEQRRPLSSGTIEVVIACQSWNLVQAINDRVALTGGFER